ncbi:MAG: hypothetical protein ACXWB9_05500 [Flavisolibacter sp.]
MRLLFVLSAILFMAVSCKKSREYEGLAIKENNCKTVHIGGQDVKICFEELTEDSRCPANANCVWEGAAKGRFKLSVNTSSSTFNLATLTLPPHYQNEAVALGYKIKLLNVFPYPGTGGGTTTADVEITQ